MTDLINIKSVEELIELFKGHQLFFVGGYVRDQIMGNISNDIDFATDMTPDEMYNMLIKKNIMYWSSENGINHGTINIGDYEVTTFRKDISCDGRNAIIEYAKTIEEDLSRRDFTCNAIAKNAFNGEIIDPFEGRKDIKNKIVRAVGNSEDRLNEDTLRAIRAITRANKDNFIIEENLINAIVNIDISNLSVERIREEFMKILETRHDTYLYIVLDKIIPEFKILYGLDGGDKHAESVYHHSLMTMQHIMKVSYKPLLAFIGLIHDIGKGFTSNDPERMFKGHEDIGAEKAKELMERMKFSNANIDYVYTLIKNHMRWHFLDGNFASPTDRTLRRAIRDIPDNFNKEEIVTDLTILTWADCQANLLNKPESFEDYTERRGIYKRALEMIREKPEVKVGAGLELNGNDLIEMGFKPSPMFNTILTDVLNKVIGEDETMKLENNKEILKKYIEETYGITERL